MTQRFNEAIWFNWQQPAVPMFLDLTFEACGRTFRDAFGFPFFTSILYYREEGTEGDRACQASWLLRYDEGVAIGRWLVDLLLLPSFANSYEHRWEHACDALLASARELMSSAGNEVDRIDSFRGAFMKYYALGAITEPVQWYCEGEISRFFEGDAGKAAARRVGVSSDAAQSALFTTSDEPYAFTIERSLLDMAGDLQANRLDNAKIADHARLFHWKANNYARAYFLTADDINTEVEELSRRDPVERLSELVAARRRALELRARVIKVLPSRIRRLTLLADEFGSGLADRRKAVMLESLSGLARAARRLAERWGVDFEDLQMFGPGEFGGLGGDHSLAIDTAPNRRLAYVRTLAPSPLDDAEMAAAIELAPALGDAVAPQQREISAADGDGALAVLNEIDSRMELFVHGEREETVRGQVVSVSGSSVRTVAGICRVIFDPIAQSSEFHDGEILLASSTTPDFVPIMRRAAAIVTNMGGMLQHAAHFAREEGKACIVGTGFVTSAFSSGDQVELDLVAGTVRRLPSDG